MGTKMTHTARAELTQVVRHRYCAAAGAEKRKILDEFIAVTGYHEKSAIRALNAEPTTKGRQTRNRPSLYDEAVRAALIVLWEASDRVCGKRLRALLPILLPALERNGHLHLRECVFHAKCTVPGHAQQKRGFPSNAEQNTLLLRIIRVQSQAR